MAFSFLNEIRIRNEKIVSEQAKAAALKNSKKKSGHTKAALPTISLTEPGRLKVKHLMALFSIGHSTLYAGMKRKKYPKPDGYDGASPYWNTETICKFLNPQHHAMHT